MMAMNRFLATGLLTLCLPMVSAGTLVQGQGSNFMMTYHPIYTASYQTVMNEAAQFWADTLRSDVLIEVYVGTVDKVCSFSYNVQVQTQPPASAINFPQAPLANTHYPIALANSLAGTDLLPGAADINIAFNARMINRSACQKWYLGYDANYDYSQYSLYFETLQELAHGLGLIALGNVTTGERLNGQDDIYLTGLKSSVTGRSVVDMTGAEIRALARRSSDLAFAGNNSWAAASALSFGRTDDALLLFTRSYDAPELTGLHLHDGTLPKQLMMVDLHDAIPETDLAVAMLEDLGWATTRNEPPQIIGQRPVTVREDERYTLTLADLILIDEAPASLSLNISSGSAYTIDQQTIIPAPNFAGTLTIPVSVSDLEYNSAPFNFVLTVSPVNDAPIIGAIGALTVLEDNSLTLSLADLNIVDPDSQSFSLMLGSGSHYQVMGTQIRPDANWSGELLVPVQVSDGLALSEVVIAHIVVTPVNDAPELTGQRLIEFEEDTELPLDRLLDHQLLLFSDVDSSVFSLVVSPGDHYQVNGDRLVPALDYAGPLTVAMQINDGQLLSATFLVTIDVLAVNDAPRLLSIAPQTIHEDGSLLVTQALLDLNDPDSSDFSLSLERGDHYQIAADKIIPDANWFGSLSINLTLSDGELSSNSLPLLLTVLPVNDLPELTGPALPTGQIYRDLDVQLTGFDLDGDALSFSLRQAPDWLELSATGLLQIRPDYRAVGEHSLEIGVSDGSATVYESRTLPILDDLSASDLSVSLAVERTLWSTNGWVPVTLTLTNLGPKSSLEAELSLSFNGEWSSQDSRCPVASNLPDTDPERQSCVLSLTDSTQLTLAVRQDSVGSSDLRFTAQHAGFEVLPDNNQARVTLTFSASTPATPQYSVPAFGKGQVRALGIANIQGGRWPELLFANGPGQASTSYRFDRSWFRPVLHSHLGDAANSYGMALFDADDDGDIDWVLANGGGEANSVYRNDGNGQFALIDRLGLANSRGVAFGDIDGDSDIDLVFANWDDPNTLYLNNGDGTFSFHAELGRTRARAVLIHDFNRDGRPDILFANYGQANQLLFNRGLDRWARALGRVGATELLEFERIELGGADDLTESMSLADLDGDGEASDIVFINAADNAQPAGLQIFTVDSDGQSSLQLQSLGSSVADLSVGDYDGDGRDDLAVLRPGGALEVMQVQSGGGLITIAVLDTDGADTVLMVDVDDSGQADIISANNQSATSRLDFAGTDLNNMALNNEAASSAVPLANPQPAGAQSPTSRGGAGLPWMLGLLLLVRRKKIAPD
ncbi:MAG: FG-GAP-like repeat-containing protein [Reinekea forsetii]|nr:FG-GAP-like repeat-containing protein [Reinekea forsetii]